MTAGAPTEATRVPAASVPRRAATGVIAGLAFSATSLLLRQVTGAPSFPEDISDLTVPLIPAEVFGKLLTSLGALGKPILVGGALVGVTAAFVLVSLVHGALVGRGWRRARLSVLVAVGGTLVLTALFGAVLDANDAGGILWVRRLINVLCYGVDMAAASLVVYRGNALSIAGGTDEGRRAVLRRAGGLTGMFALSGGALGIGLKAFVNASNVTYEGRGTARNMLTPITPTESFYVVSKNLVDPVIDLDRWRLEINGMVSAPATLTLNELRALPVVEEIVTLECVANGVGGSLMSTARWKGVRVRDILARAGTVDPAAHFVALTGADGFVDTLSMAQFLADGSMVALEMNGNPLLPRHGAPARVLIPGLYGERNMKWLAGIAPQVDFHPGFYQRQGYDRASVVRTWSRIDSLKAGDQVSAGTLLTLRGHAFAGPRGVDRVEVSTDGGRTWKDASLDPVISRYAWRFFSFPWKPDRGTHALWVRATDGTGEVQSAAFENFVPRGAAGWDRFTVSAG